MSTLEDKLYGTPSHQPAAEPTPSPHPMEELASKLYTPTPTSAPSSELYPVENLLKGAAVIGESERALQDKLGMSEAAAHTLVSDTVRLATQTLHLDRREAERFVEVITHERTRARTAEEIEAFVAANTVGINTRARETYGADAHRLATALHARIQGDPALKALDAEVPLWAHPELMAMLLEQESRRR